MDQKQFVGFAKDNLSSGSIFGPQVAASASQSTWYGVQEGECQFNSH